tara:strand:+ start:2014 stop:2190 length:177 start_codon:yes stop_codon:yes gene_type:complete
MIGIQVEISKGVDKFAGFISTNLGDHESQEGIGGDVERDSEEEVGTSLVELTTETGAL